MNLRIKLFLFLIGLVATLVFLAALVTNRVVVGTAKERLAQQLAAAEPLYRSAWESRTRLLIGAIESIAGTDYVKRVLGLLYESPDPAAARETVRDLARDLLGRQLDQADLLFVADGEGRIVVADTLKLPGVAVPAQLPLTLPSHQDGRPVIRTGFQLLGSRLLQLVSMPILVQSPERGQRRLLAILTTGYEVTREVATSLGNAAQGDVLIFVGPALYASTLPASQEPFSPDLVSSIAGERSRVRKAEVAGKQYMAFVEPLRGLTGEQIGTLVLLQSLESAVQLARAIQRWLIVLGLGTLLLGGVLSFVLTRTVVTPLERLDRAAVELGRGNYDYAIGAAGRDEVGRLATTFNQMRASLRSTQEEVKERNRELQKKGEQLTRLATLAQTVTASLDPQRVFEAVVKGTLQLLHVTLARLWVIEPSTGKAVSVASAFAPDRPINLEGALTQMPPGQGIVGSVIAHGRSRYSPVLAEDLLLAQPEWVKREGLVSHLAVPLHREDRVLGALTVATRERREFSPDERELLQTFAAQAVLAIEKAKFYEETQRRLQQTETLLAVSQAVSSTLELTEILRRTSREMARALGADMGGAWLISLFGDRLLPHVGYHLPKELLETFARTPPPIWHHLVEEAEGPIYSSDSQANPRFVHSPLRLLPHKSVLAVPIWLKGEMIGGFVIVWVREAHNFTPEELRLVEGIARQAATAIENARLLEAEREARERLELSEARYRVLFENAIDIVYLHDLEGKFLAVNEAAGRVSGYAREELLGMNIAQLVAPEDLTRNMELIRRMIQGERIREFFTTGFVRKDGSRGVLECSGRLVFKDGVPVAIQGVARDVTARRQLEQRQAAFAEIVKELAAESDFDRLFPLIAERICQLIGTDSAALIVLEGDEVVNRGHFGFDHTMRLRRRRKLSESRVRRIVQTRTPHVSSDMAADPHWCNSPIVTQQGYRAIAEVPVTLRGEVIGVLGALHKTPRAFSAEAVALLVSLADHVAIALDRASLRKKTEARLRETETLLAVSQAVSSTLDLTEMMRGVARMTALSLGADMVGVYLADPDLEALRPIAGYHVPKHLLETFREFPIPLKGHRFFEDACERQRPVFSSDAEADARIDRETFERFPHRAVLFAPMIVKGKLIGGFFAIWWNHSHQFTSDELHLVEGISHQAALAVDNARLFASQQEEAEISGTLLRVAEAVASRQDLHAVLETVVGITPQLLGLTRCGFFLLDPAEGALIPTAAWGLSNEHRPAFFSLRGKPQIPAVVKAIERQAPVVVEDVVRGEGIPRKVAAALDIRSMLIIPLMSGARLMGTMAVDTPGVLHTFTSKQIALAQGIATHAAVAIDNARLFQETQGRLRETQALLAVSQAVSTTLDLTEAMRRVARETALALGADMVGVYLADADQKYLRPVAGYHVPKHLLEAFMKFPIPLKGHRILEEALERRQPIWSSNVAADPRIDRESFEHFPHRSNLFFPMVVKGEPIGGFFVTWWEEEHQFTPEELRLVEGISRQAALAIEDTRLFEEVERRRRAAESLAEVGQLMSQSLDPQEVGQRIVDSLRELFGTKMAVLYRLDPESEGLHLLAGIGPDVDWNKVLKGTATAGLAVRERQPITTPDLLTDPRIELTPDARARIERSGYQAVLAVPLVVSDRVIGALGIGDQAGRVFDAEEIRLAQAFANQAAIALANAQLYERVKQAAAELEAKVIERTRELAEKTRELEAFTHTVSHDLKAPLRGIEGFAKLLLKGYGERFDDTGRHYLERVRAGTQRMGLLIDDLLRYSRLERRSRHKTRVELASLVQAVLEERRPRIEAQRARVRTDLRVPEVEGEAEGLRAALANLVDNALKFVRPDASPEVTIWSEERPEEWILAVADNGIGFDMQYHDRIFEIFQRLHRLEEYDGTGVGLAIVKKVAERHVGRVWAESHLGQGSTFYFALPKSRGKEA